MIQRVVSNRVFQLLSVMMTAAMILIAIPSCKKPEKRTYVIGYVNSNPEEEKGSQGFLSNMPNYGYIEGQNVTYIRSETRDKKIMENALREMVAKKVDLIFAITTPAAVMARKITEGTNIPVVFVMYDAVGAGVVKSLINHGGNMTGVQLMGSMPKALQCMLAIRPGAKHMWVPVCFDTGAADLSLADLKLGASKRGLRLTVSKVETADELHSALSSMPKGVDGIFILHSWLVGCNVKAVLDEAVRRKIPVVSAGHVHFDDGLILSYGPRNERTGPQAARLADKILHGTPAADLPVETSEFFLGINLKTAGATGLRISDDILRQADFIVREQERARATHEGKNGKLNGVQRNGSVKG